VAARHVAVSVAVEGLLDEAVLLRVIEHCGFTVGPIHGKGGMQHLLQRLSGYNRAAFIAPWCVLVDLDQDSRCLADCRDAWLPQPAPLMRFRIVVQEIEAWLFGDRERLASYLGVARSRLPSVPESVLQPKEAMVDLARRSRRADVREDMVPRSGSGRKVGPAYVSRLIQFASDLGEGWDPKWHQRMWIAFGGAWLGWRNSAARRLRHGVRR